MTFFNVKKSLDKKENHEFILTITELILKNFKKLKSLKLAFRNLPEHDFEVS